MNISMAVQTRPAKKFIFPGCGGTRERVKIGIWPGRMDSSYRVMATLAKERRLSGKKPGMVTSMHLMTV
jgi:hypothetical protein